MLIGNKTFGIDFEWVGNNDQFFLLEDRCSAIKVRFHVNSNIIPSDLVVTAGYSLAKWMSLNFDLIDLTIPQNFNYNTPEELVKQLFDFCKNSNKRDQVGPIEKWLDEHTINRFEDSGLPTITFIPEDNFVNVVWINDSEGSAKVPSTEIKNVFKYFIISVSMFLRKTDYAQAGQRLIGRWRR